MSATSSSLTAVLQEVRRQRRWSQLELSFRLGVSQRHVSFVESGRAKPSRSLLLAWLQELEVPLPLRNQALLQAGYAPAYGSAPIDVASKVEAFAAALRARLGAQATQHGGWSRPAAPVLTTRYATAVGELAFFSMFTTFGTPQEITLASLRVEHLFAADAATRTVLEANVR